MHKFSLTAPAVHKDAAYIYNISQIKCAFMKFVKILCSEKTTRQ